MRGVRAACALLLLATGCRGSTADISMPPPPSPKTWASYPDFSKHSCWSRRLSVGHPDRSEAVRFAPSAPIKTPTGTAPTELVRRLLKRFGDRRYVKSISLKPVEIGHDSKSWWRRHAPPRDALVAEVSTPRRPTALRDWELALALGGLRDDFCAAGGPSLVAWTSPNEERAFDDSAAMNQRFPNPSEREFRRRVRVIGEHFGFRPVEIRLLHPREHQLAPLVVVRTERDRKDFVDDVPRIATLLNPRSDGPADLALTFEGLYLEARDSKGPFLQIFNNNRGENGGGQWADAGGAYPFPHG